MVEKKTKLKMFSISIITHRSNAESFTAILHHRHWYYMCLKSVALNL